MKKIVSLLLAGLMVLGMAATVMAGNVTTGTKLPVETIYSGKYGYIYNDGFIYYPNGWYPIGGKDPVDPGFSVPPAPDALYWYGEAECPTENCKEKCNVYLLPADIASVPYAYCKNHGLQVVDFKNVTIPGESASAEYTIYTRSFAGGSILLNGSVSVSGITTVKRGETVEVKVVPDYGYIVEGIYVNGYYVDTEDTFKLTNIHRDFSIRAIFRKIDVNRPYTIKAESVGEGGVYAVVNGKSVGEITSLTGTYADKVTLRFTTASSSYSVESVVINGVNKGKISFYEVGRMLADMTVKATFVWNCPYTDVVKEHMDAVEYVTEIDVMGTPNKHIDTDKFEGKRNVTVRAMACYFAELADVEGKLDTAAQRVEWCISKGLLSADEKQNVNATWTRACDMLNGFVRLLETEGKITFKALENAKTAYDVANIMDVVTEVSYKADSAITRYDMAEICYAVSLLEVK